MRARQAEVGRQLAERDGAYPARGVAAYLLRRKFGVPERHQAERHEPATGPAAPLLDHPVVVGLHAQQRELTVLAVQEDLAGEARIVRVAELRLHVVAIHVGEAVLLLPAAGAHLLERDAGEADLVGGIARGGDEPLHRIAVVLVAPPGDIGAFGAGRLDVGAAGELRGTGRVVLDVRADVAILRRQPARPHVGRLDDVGVDIDQRRDAVNVRRLAGAAARRHNVDRHDGHPFPTPTVPVRFLIQD